MPSLYEFAGGEEALHRLEDIFSAASSKIRCSSRFSGLASLSMSIT
jgi:hypothetical protein